MRPAPKLPLHGPPYSFPAFAVLPANALLPGRCPPRLAVSGPSRPTYSVFLSYASEDRHLAAPLASALRGAGVDVWFDANELRGGDAWDDEIRSRIKTCTFFVALVTPRTDERAEGYFRREWKMAVERSHDMAEDRPFILPVAVGGVRAEVARVPARFQELQWVALETTERPDAVVAALDRLHQRLLALGTSRTPWSAAATGGEPRRRTGPWLRPALLAAAALAVAATVAGTLLLQRDGERAAAPVAARPPIEENSVAVLPFANLSGDAGDDYLGEGLAEEVLGALSRDQALRIVARTSSFLFKGKSVPVQEIAAQLGVAKLVQGSVRRQGNQLKIAVQLVNGLNGFQIWSREYPIQLTGLFEVQATVAADVAARLLPSFAGRVARRPPATRSLDAYDAFLRARSYQAKPPIRENLEAAVRLFARATVADSAYAVAWARHAGALIRLNTSGFDDHDTALKEARASIERAMAIDPELPEAHYALATFYTLNWTNQSLAEKELQIALQSIPNDPDVLTFLAACHLNLGRFPDAVRHIRRAVLIDPQNADTANFCAIVLDHASNYPEALAERRRADRLAGGTILPVDEALIHRNWKGDVPGALAILDRSRLDGADAAERNYYWRYRAAFLRVLGDYAGAGAALDRLEGQVVGGQFFYHTAPALRAALLEEQGDAAAAREHYGRALALVEPYRDAHPSKLRGHASLALIYAGLGREAEARAAARRCLDLVPAHENPLVAATTGLRVLAQIDARFGRIDSALELVRTQSAAGFWRRHDLLLDTDWWLLRRDPRFAEIAKSAPL